jgi:hypothetical protein
MPIEADVDTPRSVVEQLTSEWLDRVEASVERAHAALLGSERADLLPFSSEMESACRESRGLTATPAVAARLGTLRERLTLLQVMLRQAAALIEGRAQLETQTFLGYTPRGLERAL